MSRRTTVRILIVATSAAVVCLMVYSRGGRASTADRTGDKAQSANRVQVSGVVRQAERPIEGLRVSLSGAQGNRYDAVTGPTGEFSVNVDSVGDYNLTVKTLPNMSSTDRQITLTAGHNTVDVDLPPSQVDLAVTAADGIELPGAVQLMVHGPSSPNFSRRAGFVLNADLSTARLVGMGWGEYTIFATSGELVSAAPAKFTLSSATPRVTAQLVLIRRSLSLIVEDPDGATLRGARVFTFGRVPRERQGQFDLSGVPAGDEILVTYRGYQPTCRLAAANTTSQRVRLVRAGPASLEIILSPAPKRALGLLDGLPGSECPVAISAFSTQLSPRAGTEPLTFKIKGLSPGAYQYRADSMAAPSAAQAPGSPVRYTVPPRCTICG